MLKTLVAYRLLDPGCEWKLHHSWFDRSAMADLLDDDFRLAAKDTLYRCHDRLLNHREALLTHLKERWSGLFGASYDILLYDLTSTCFEVDANGLVTDGRELRMKRYTKPEKVHQLLLEQLGFILPTHPPARNPKPVVETF